MTTALSLNGVTKRYGDFTAVQSLSFEVGTGQICGFLGPNGAGKTSTIRMILGLVAPTEGTIEVLGAKDARKVRERIGFLPEERGLYKRMTPVGAIAFFAGLKGMGDREARRGAKEMLEEQGLGSAMNRPIKALSKGMSQKVQLLSAIAHDPELVILDEAFSGLDPVNQQSLETIIRGLASKGSTVLFSTHVMQHAERLCDRVVLMARGRKMFDGDLAQARSHAPRLLVLEGNISLQAVQALPGIERVEVADLAGQDGTDLVQLSATLKPGANGQEALRAAFSQGLDLRRFELKEPTLHDAFIALTGDQI
jgi:ABC-2 type transport system ATP-binding protein